MFGWRSKIVLGMVVYFCGFATAIYTLAPSGQNNGKSRLEEFFTNGFSKISFSDLAEKQHHKSEDQPVNLRAQEITADLKDNLQKLMCFAEEKASRAGGLIKAKFEEKATAKR